MPDIRLTDGPDTYEHPQGAEWTDIFGLKGDDKLHSHNNAQLIGGPGNDTLSSEANDRWGGNAAYWDSPTSIYVDLAEGYALDGWGTRDTLIGISNINSSGRNGDKVLGDHRNNHFGVNGFWQAGTAFFDGREGFDSASIWDRQFKDFKLWVSADARTFTLEFNGYKAEITNVEELQFNGPDQARQSYPISDLIDFNTVGEQTLIAASSHGWKNAELGSGRTLSYSFMLTEPGYAAAQGLSGFVPPNAAYVKAVRDVFTRLSGELNVRFVEADESVGQTGQLRFGSSQQASTKGVAFMPGVVADARAGDVFMDVDSLGKLEPGQEGYQALLHEIGHALGLSHPLTSPDGSSRPLLLPKWQDPAYTLMVNGPSMSGLWQTWFGVFDLQALQKLYGAPPAAVVQANNVFDLHDGHGRLVFTLSDAGGSDTLDLSALSFGASIDLRPGAASSVGQNAQGVASQNNMIIAPGTLIESVKGTPFDDVLKGNDHNNFFAPGSGNDIIDGRAGFDQIYFDETRQEVEVLLSEWSGDWMVSDRAGLKGSDSLRNIDRLHFSDRSVALDVQGRAGDAAKAMALLLGRQTLQDPSLTGLVLHLMDANNLSLEQIMDLGLKFVLGANPSRERVIELLYTGLVGVAPGAAETAALVGLLNQHSPAQLAVVAAGLEGPTQVSLALMGVQTQGLDYIPVAG